MQKLIILIILISVSLFSQKNFLTVYSVTGTVKYQQDESGKIRKLLPGEKLYRGIITLQNNSSLQVVNPESKTKMIDKQGQYTVAAISDDLAKMESKSVFERLINFIFDKMDASKDKKYGLATIEGAINKSAIDKIELYFPNTSTLFLKEYEFNWEKTGGAVNYNLSLISGEDTLFNINTPETRLLVNMKELKITNFDTSAYYLVLRDSFGTESKKKPIYFISEEQQKYVDTILSEISNSKKESTEESEITWARATFLELNNLIYDAYFEYQRAIKFNTKSREYLLLFQEFLKRYSINSELE